MRSLRASSSIRETAGFKYNEESPYYHVIQRRKTVPFIWDCFFDVESPAWSDCLAFFVIPSEVSEAKEEIIGLSTKSLLSFRG